MSWILTPHLFAKNAKNVNLWEAFDTLMIGLQYKTYPFLSDTHGRHTHPLWGSHVHFPKPCLCVALRDWFGCVYSRVNLDKSCRLVGFTTNQSGLGKNGGAPLCVLASQHWSTNKWRKGSMRRTVTEASRACIQYVCLQHMPHVSLVLDSRPLSLQASIFTNAKTHTPPTPHDLHSLLSIWPPSTP